MGIYVQHMEPQKQGRQQKKMLQKRTRLQQKVAKGVLAFQDNPPVVGSDMVNPCSMKLGSSAKTDNTCGTGYGEYRWWTQRREPARDKPRVRKISKLLQNNGCVNKEQ